MLFDSEHSATEPILFSTPASRQSRRACGRRKQSVSVMRLVVLLPFENSLDVPTPMQNPNDAQGVRLNDVEDEDVFEAFYGP